MDLTNLREMVVIRLGWAGQEDVENRFGENEGGNVAEWLRALDLKYGGS